MSTGQDLLGNNMFAYCGNSPVNYIDSAGMRREHFELSVYEREHTMADSVPEPIDNTLELSVLRKLEENGFALYNGVPVFVG